jgi:cation:H+ antiporter
MILPWVYLAVGLALLVKGAEWLVAGAAALARRLRVSDLTIGLTVVAFGTSMPEFVVSMLASLQGNNDIALGNVLGSNICNILLILGVAGLICPLAVVKRTVRLEIPLSLLAAVMVWVLGNDMLLDGATINLLTCGKWPANPAPIAPKNCPISAA